MPVFELTKKQELISEPCLMEAEKAFQDGKKGMIIGQIVDWYGQPICKFYFVPNEPAGKIVDILDDFIKNKKEERR